MFKTNLKIAMERLKSFILPGSEKAEESKLSGMGEEFELIIDLVKSPSVIKEEMLQSRTDS